MQSFNLAQNQLPNVTLGVSATGATAFDVIKVVPPTDVSAVISGGQTRQAATLLADHPTWPLQVAPLPLMATSRSNSRSLFSPRKSPAFGSSRHELYLQFVASGRRTGVGGGRHNARVHCNHAFRDRLRRAADVPRAGLPNTVTRDSGSLIPGKPETSRCRRPMGALSLRTALT